MWAYVLHITGSSTLLTQTDEIDLYLRNRSLRDPALHLPLTRSNLLSPLPPPLCVPTVTQHGWDSHSGDIRSAAGVQQPGGVLGEPFQWRWHGNRGRQAVEARWDTLWLTFMPGPSGTWMGEFVAEVRWAWKILLLAKSFGLTESYFSLGLAWVQTDILPVSDGFGLEFEVCLPWSSKRLTDNCDPLVTWNVLFSVGLHRLIERKKKKNHNIHQCNFTTFQMLSF